MAYSSELRQVEVFKYLGRPLAADDYDIPAMRHNLQKARSVWARIARVLEKEEIPAPVAAMFYQAVVVAVLLYGSESWYLPPTALNVLEGFHVEAPRLRSIKKHSNDDCLVKYRCNRRRNLFLVQHPHDMRPN